MKAEFAFTIDDSKDATSRVRETLWEAGQIVRNNLFDGGKATVLVEVGVRVFLDLS